MKFFSPAMVFTALSLFTACALAADSAPEPSGCAAKRQDISARIEQAKTAGNSDQQAGLEKALSEVTANCTEASLLKEQEKKVLDAKREVSTRQSDLDKAMKKGDPDKINKRKDKLAESRKELQDEQQKLEQLQPDEDDE
ncbi:DUF1090 domain-containing protein [Pseudomonas sp. LP_7_YM]|uniref:DUF1090 domain-containing protein n=1 Tax=Pseudomonas sp. LP_7_YM TaxID=2485137 RepID=UPI00105CE783|nr:DUF1090 domain-containing protein [Pseudomonas sp. LP_7_YM]TDV59429.1 uncharacterized protein DUF1090 [Pseudomonas sp. LP_7_YM]